MCVDRMPTEVMGKYKMYALGVLVLFVVSKVLDVVGNNTNVVFYVIGNCYCRHMDYCNSGGSTVVLFVMELVENLQLELVNSV